MRQRKIKNQEEKLAALSGRTVEHPQEWRGRWRELFGNDRPIYLEVGCGKGKFITTLAEEHPQCNYLAVEGQESVILRALERAERAELANLRFIPQYVKEIRELFAEGELTGLYLNFSDPWPKDRHAKRRLTHPDFLEGYRQILGTGRFFEIKTDNDGLYAFTLESIERCGMEIVVRADDLHGASLFEFGSDGMPGETALRRPERLTEEPERTEALAGPRHVTTEYEDKFRKLGNPIHFLRVRV